MFETLEEIILKQSMEKVAKKANKRVDLSKLHIRIFFTHNRQINGIKKEIMIRKKLPAKDIWQIIEIKSFI